MNFELRIATPNNMVMNNENTNISYDILHVLRGVQLAASFFFVVSRVDYIPSRKKRNS